MPISARMFHGSDRGRGLALAARQKHTKRVGGPAGFRNLIALVGGAVLKPSLALSPMAAIADACYRREPASQVALVCADTMPTSRAGHLRENK
jgi:hypothetical protein